MKKTAILLTVSLIVILFIAATSVKNAMLKSDLNVKEDIGFTLLGSPDVIHSSMNESIYYTDGATKYDVDNVYSQRYTSTDSIDLTGITDTRGNTVDLTGERIVAMKFKNASSSSDSVVLTETSTNPYPLMSSGYKITLKGGQSILFNADTTGFDISATRAQIKVEIYGSDSLDITLITADMQ